MNKPIFAEIRARLEALRDEEYRAFQGKLIPTVAPKDVIGVRTPALRALAKELAKRPEIAAFLAVLPHESYEENNLHAFLIEQIVEFDACVAEIDRFLPYVDNWATCDMLCPKRFAKRPAGLLPAIFRWTAADDTYTIRFGIRMLMAHYLDEAFSPEYPALVAALRSEEYYVNMMIAWYFATALAKQYDAVLPYFTAQRLDVWTHNKAIQKACESYRVSAAHKAQLRALKRK